LLSSRERQVVHYLAEGLTNREIGVQLGLSRHTIKNYLLKIFDKLGVSNRVELLFLTLSHPSPAVQFPQVPEDVKKV
jgi:two-component system response regulator DevR